MLIFIPLCIYFNAICSISSPGRIAIYIPLCIYFNLFQFSISNLFQKFTFHYVSISTWQPDQKTTLLFIYIPLCIYFNILNSFHVSTHFVFTFHYVSISTLCGCIPCSTMHHLHSTMYLFQRLYC